MAFSQRARAYTLNPTLPCPTLPLSPRALSDSSIIPAAGRLCLKFKLRRGRRVRRRLPAAGLIEEYESARGAGNSAGRDMPGLVERTICQGV